MPTPILLRPMDASSDCDGVAQVRSGCFPDWPVTAAEVADGEVRRRDRFHFPWVALHEGRIVGYGYVEEPNVAARPGRLRMRVLVEPSQRRQGIGAALYDALLRAAVNAGANELVTEAQGDDTEAQRFAERRGFLEYHRRLESRLSMATVSPAEVGRGIERLTDALFPTGVRIASYRQLLLVTSEAARRLYDLDGTLWADVPFGITGSVPTFEQYLAEDLASPDFLPAATFVALDRDRWIGLGAVMNGRGFLYNSMTGVVREWRGRGLARWLKLHTLRWALERGAPELRTFNDDGNEAILSLNRSLGFRVARVERRYRKELG